MVKSSLDVSYLNKDTSDGAVEDDAESPYIDEVKTLIKKGYFLDRPNKDGWYQVQLGAPFSTELCTDDYVYVNDIEAAIDALTQPNFVKRLNKAGALIGEPNVKVKTVYAQINLEQASHCFKDINVMRVRDTASKEYSGTYIITGKVKPLETPNGVLLKQLLDDPTKQVDFILRAFIDKQYVKDVIVERIADILTWDWKLVD